MACHGREWPCSRIGGGRGGKGGAGLVAGTRIGRSATSISFQQREKELKMVVDQLVVNKDALDLKSS